MNVAYACCQCHQTNRQDLDETTTTLRCAHCGYEQRIPAGAIEDGQVHRCVVCPSDELFVRKDFSQRLGLTIIVLGFVASSMAWYFYLQYVAFGILLATALIDVLLYWLVGNLLQCYRCRAEYRGLRSLESYEGFDLETHEKHRQQEARLGQARAAEARVAEARRISDRDTADRDTADRDTADGNTADGNTADGNTADRDTADRNSVQPEEAAEPRDGGQRAEPVNPAGLASRGAGDHLGRESGERPAE